MSYPMLADKEPDDQMEKERFRRVREIVERFGDAGITVVQENCGDYGGMGWNYSFRLLENVPGLKLVFDTGNPVVFKDYSKPDPRPLQSSWEFYDNVREHIAHVHIKDRARPVSGEPSAHTFPGEGAGDVERILGDLLKNGYNAGISIEPHLTGVRPEFAHMDEASGKIAQFVEYGRRMVKIIDDLGHGESLKQSGY